MKKENHREYLVNRKPRTKPKVVKEWGEDDIFKLISLVEDEKCLWDTGDEAYHNKMLRGHSWRNIAENFHLKYSVADLNAKWTNLRIQFRSYAGRAKIKTGLGAIKPPKWRFYNAMSFVARSEDQQTHQNIPNNVSDAESDSNSIDYDTKSSPLLTQSEDPITIRRQLSGNSDLTATLNAKAMREDPIRLRRQQDGNELTATQLAQTLREDPITLRRQQDVNSKLTATQIAETMHDVAMAMTERAQNNFEPNTSFSYYLLSELKTLDKDAAASVRKKVTIFFLQCLEEERTKKINGAGIP